MILIKSIRSLTRNDRTDSILIPVYGTKDRKYNQVISQTLIEVRDLAKALQYRLNLNHGYVVLSNHKGPLHRHLFNTPKGFQTDHINRIPLDNRCSNLRVATSSQNGMNQGIRSDNTSGYKGVSWNKWHYKWEVRIKLNGKKIYLGYYTDIHDAARVYNKASLKYHGKFGQVNVI